MNAEMVNKKRKLTDSRGPFESLLFIALGEVGKPRDIAPRLSNT